MQHRYPSLQLAWPTRPQFCSWRRKWHQGEWKHCCYLGIHNRSCTPTGYWRGDTERTSLEGTSGISEHKPSESDEWRRHRNRPRLKRRLAGLKTARRTARGRYDDLLSTAPELGKRDVEGGHFLHTLLGRISDEGAYPENWNPQTWWK